MSAAPAPEMMQPQLGEAEYAVLAAEVFAAIGAAVETAGGNKLDSAAVVTLLLLECVRGFAPNEPICLAMIHGCVLAQLGGDYVKLAALAAAVPEGRA